MTLNAASEIGDWSDTLGRARYCGNLDGGKAKMYRNAWILLVVLRDLPS